VLHLVSRKIDPRSVADPYSGHRFVRGERPMELPYCRTKRRLIAGPSLEWAVRRSQSFDRRTFLRAGAAGLAVAAGGTAAGRSQEPGSGHAGETEELLVGVSASAAGSVQETVAAHAPSDARVTGANGALGYAALALPADAPETARRALVDATERVDAVEYVEPNGTYGVLATPNDPLFDGPDSQYVPQLVGAPEAWDDTFGDRGVTIAVVDSGVQYDHPDLAANVRSAAAGGPGRDFVDDDGDPYPDGSGENHGTKVAGIATAVTNNDTGIAGLSQSTLLCGRALAPNANGTLEGRLADVADAIQWAADEGADVISLSLGRYDRADETLRRAVEYAESQGALVVAAAGNNGGSVAFPAAFEACLAVSWLEDDGVTLDERSSRGPEIELAAPGVVGTTTLAGTGDGGGDYTFFEGSSAAAPVVSGVAGLALARWNLSGAELRDHLRNTATDIGLSGEKQGAGRVDAAKAVGTVPRALRAFGAADLDRDGRYEDVNGDGEVGVVDVQSLFVDRDADRVREHPNAFDFNGDGRANVNDVQTLFSDLRG
jgi:serine protease